MRTDSCVALRANCDETALHSMIGMVIVLRAGGPSRTPCEEDSAISASHKFGATAVFERARRACEHASVGAEARTPARFFDYSRAL